MRFRATGEIHLAEAKAFCLQERGGEKARTAAVDETEEGVSVASYVSSLRTTGRAWPRRGRHGYCR